MIVPVCLSDNDAIFAVPLPSIFIAARILAIDQKRLYFV